MKIVLTDTIYVAVNVRTEILQVKLKQLYLLNSGKNNNIIPITIAIF